MTYEQTIESVGNPTRKRDRKNKDGSFYQEWTYERFTRGPQAITGLSSGNTEMNRAEQSTINKVIVIITFSVHGRIKAVKIRIRKENPSVFKPKRY